MTDTHALEQGRTVPSLVPARMDRLPWTKFHWLIVIGLGVAKPLSARETAGATRSQGPMPRLPSVDQRHQPPTNPGDGGNPGGSDPDQRRESPPDT